MQRGISRRSDSATSQLRNTPPRPPRPLREGDRSINGSPLLFPPHTPPSPRRVHRFVWKGLLTDKKRAKVAKGVVDVVHATGAAKEVTFPLLGKKVDEENSRWCEAFVRIYGVGGVASGNEMPKGTDRYRKFKKNITDNLWKPAATLPRATLTQTQKRALAQWKTYCETQIRGSIVNLQRMQAQHQVPLPQPHALNAMDDERKHEAMDDEREHEDTDDELQHEATGEEFEHEATGEEFEDEATDAELEHDELELENEATNDEVNVNENEGEVSETEEPSTKAADNDEPRIPKHVSGWSATKAPLKSQSGNGLNHEKIRTNHFDSRDVLPTCACAHQNVQDDDYLFVDDCVREVEEFEANNLTIKGPYTLEEFEDMWKKVEVNLGATTSSIEHGKLIRGANSKIIVEDSGVQSKAQYGRVLPLATNKLLTEILQLNQTDVFVDIGHGIGNACLQAAYTIGCEARGIEVVPDRHFVAQQFWADLANLNEICCTRDSVLHKVGHVDLRQGSLEASSHRKFLTKDITVAFVNNFNGVFRERSSDKPLSRFLDDYLAGLLALMSPGARLVSFHPLPLCLSRKDANQRRGRFGLAESDDASFFEFEEMDLDEARFCVSWSEGGGNKKMIRLFKYTRVHQSVDHSVFLCSNPKCDNAKNAIPIDATVENSDGRVVLNKCTCGYEACNLRSRGGKRQTRQEQGKRGS